MLWLGDGVLWIAEWLFAARRGFWMVPVVLCFQAELCLGRDQAQERKGKARKCRPFLMQSNQRLGN